MFQTTHERYSANKGEVETLLDSTHSRTQSSIIGSILRSDMLVHDDAEISELSPQIHIMQTKHDSWVEEVNKDGVVEGNYMAEMEYTQPKKVKRHRCG